jgi:Putative lumazine-binding
VWGHDDHEAISACIATYLDGLYDGDADKIALVFHPASALTYEEQGTIRIVPRDEWLHAVRNRPSPRARQLPRHDLVLQIDQSAQGTAFVKLKCAVPPRYFTDYLSLLKLAGQWQIVQKVYAIEVREEGSK